jgi:hypothetical protein
MQHRVAINRLIGRINLTPNLSRIIPQGICKIPYDMKKKEDSIAI